MKRILYDIIETGSTNHERLSASEIAKINRLRSLLGDDIRSSDTLELIVSIHFLREKARSVNASESEVRVALKKMKPYFTDREIDRCWQKSIELDKMVNKP